MDEEKNLEQAIEQEMAEELAGIDPAFHEVVKKYGRKMFALVMNAGMAQQAVLILAGVVDKHQSRHGIHAVGIISDAFNQVSNSYVKLMAWDEALLAQCDRDIQLAFAGKIQVPGQSPIILNS